MKESNIYPGEFVPSPEMETRRIFKKIRSRKKDSLSVNVKESDEEVTIEVALPGVSRDKLAVYICANILSVKIFGSVVNNKPQLKSSLHEFDSGYVERHIVLPKDVDTDFMSAEFSRGILRLHIPRKCGGAIARERQVFVY